MKAYIGDRNEVIHSFDYAITPSGRRIIAVARASTKNGNGVLVYYSDNGLDWSVNFLNLNSASTSSPIRSVTIIPSTGEVVAMNARSGSSLIIRRSTDFGATWTVQNSSVSLSGLPTEFTGLTYDVGGNRFLLYPTSITTGVTNVVLQSTDDCVTWTPLITTTSSSTVRQFTLTKVYESESRFGIIAYIGVNSAVGFKFYGFSRNSSNITVGPDLPYTVTVPLFGGFAVKAAYHPISKKYFLTSVSNAYPNFVDINDGLTTLTAHVLPAQQTGEYVCNLSWYPSGNYMVATTRDSAATGRQDYQRVAKSRSAEDGTWAYDPAPTFNVSNSEAKMAFFDTSLGLLQAYVSGNIYLGNTIGYFGIQANMPTPTPSPTQTMSATPFNIQNGVVLGGIQSEVNGVPNQRYSYVSNDGTQTLSANIKLEPSNAAIYDYIHIPNTNEIMIWGNYSSIGDNVLPQVCINKIDIGGTLNPTFVTSGFTAGGTTGTNVNSVIQVGPDAFVAALSSGVNRIVKFNGNGVADPTWGSIHTNVPNPNVFLDKNDPTKIYVTSMSKIMRILVSDASIDPTFAQNAVNQYISQVECLDDGKLLVYGAFTNMVGDSTFKYLVRLFNNGNIDTTFNVGLNSGPVNAGNIKPMAVLEDQSIILGGSFTSVDGDTTRRYLVKINSDGRLDTKFKSTQLPPNGVVNGVRILSDGRIYVGGSFTTIDGTPKSYVARLLSDGSLDSTFNPSITVVSYGMYFASEYNYPKVTVTPTVTPSITPTMTPMPSPVFQGFSFNFAPVNGETI